MCSLLPCNTCTRYSLCMYCYFHFWILAIANWLLFYSIACCTYVSFLHDCHCYNQLNCSTIRVSGNILAKNVQIIINSDNLPPAGNISSICNFRMHAAFKCRNNKISPNVHFSTVHVVVSEIKSSKPSMFLLCVVKYHLIELNEFYNHVAKSMSRILYGDCVTHMSFTCTCNQRSNGHILILF